MELKPLAFVESPSAERTRHAGAPARADAHDAVAAAAEERELVAACLRGDAAARRRFWDRHHRRVFAVSARIAGTQDAEEIVQEVFLKAFRALDKFRGEAALSTWMYRLAVNAALSHVARVRADKPGPTGDDALAGLPADAEPERDPRLAVRLERALASLPPGYRAVLVLHDIEGVEHEEIAAILGISVGTSKSQLHKARARMRAILGPSLAGGGR